MEFAPFRFYVRAKPPFDNNRNESLIISREPDAPYLHIVMREGIA